VEGATAIPEEARYYTEVGKAWPATRPSFKPTLALRSPEGRDRCHGHLSGSGKQETTELIGKDRKVSLRGI